MWNRSFIKRLFIGMFLCLNVFLQAQDFDTLIYSSKNKTIIGQDTVIFYVERDDLDYKIAAKKGQYREAIQYTKGSKYNKYQDELHLWYRRAIYYSYLGNHVKAIEILRKNLIRLEYDNIHENVFFWPELIELKDEPDYLDLLDTFLVKNNMDSLSGLKYVSDL